jgi:hypothetical protein
VNILRWLRTKTGAAEALTSPAEILPGGSHAAVTAQAAAPVIIDGPHTIDDTYTMEAHLLYEDGAKIKVTFKRAQ